MTNIELTYETPTRRPRFLLRATLLPALLFAILLLSLWTLTTPLRQNTALFGPDSPAITRTALFLADLLDFHRP